MLLNRDLMSTAHSATEAVTLSRQHLISDVQLAIISAKRIADAVTAKVWGEGHYFIVASDLDGSASKISRDLTWAEAMKLMEDARNKPRDVVWNLLDKVERKR